MTQHSAKKRVVIVDDEAPMLRVISNFLTKKGYDVTSYISSQEALEACSDTPPDLLITDILMPEMNGVELIEAIHTVIPQLPVICFSGHATPSTLEQLEKQHIEAFLQKPVKLKDLEENVIKALAKQQKKEKTPKTKNKLPSLLVVDDNAALLDSLRLFLLHEGFTVSTCVDGKEALECYTICRPDIIITDLIMPNINGIELIKTIKKANPEQAIIPMSGECSKADIIECEKISGTAVLRKPIDFVEVLKILKSFDRKELQRVKRKQKERILEKATTRMKPSSQEKFHKQWKKKHNKQSAKLPLWKVTLLIMTVSLIAGSVIAYLTKPTIEPSKTKKEANGDMMKMGSDMLKYLNRDENRELDRALR